MNMAWVVILLSHAGVIHWQPSTEARCREIEAAVSIGRAVIGEDETGAEVEIVDAVCMPRSQAESVYGLIVPDYEL